VLVDPGDAGSLFALRGARIELRGPTLVLSQGHAMPRSCHAMPCHKGLTLPRKNKRGPPNASGGTLSFLRTAPLWVFGAPLVSRSPLARSRMFR
jgi:hypothetical protein